MTNHRIAPVQDKRGATVPMPSIPWGLHEMLWRIYADHGHGDQSAHRLAERGGFGRLELGMLAVGAYGDSNWPAKGKRIPLLDLYAEVERLRGALSEIIEEGYDGQQAVEQARNALASNTTQERTDA